MAKNTNEHNKQKPTPQHLEKVEQLIELHKLQGVLLHHLKKELKKK